MTVEQKLCGEVADWCLGVQVEETVDLTQDDNDEEELPAAPAQGGRASTGGMDSSGEADLDAMPLF